MKNHLSSIYILHSPESEINKFIENNENTLEILDYIQSDLIKSFPETTFSLELCNNLQWTTVSNFNKIYEKIEPLIQDIFCPIVLFPELSNENYDKRSYNSVINLIARTAYFNNDFDKNIQREMSLREIPKEQMEKEILEYCRTHPNPDFSDVVYDLQLDIFDVDDIIDELESSGMKLNVKY